MDFPSGKGKSDRKAGATDVTGSCEIIRLRADRATRPWWSMEVSSAKHMEGLTDNVETPYSRCILVWTLLASSFKRRFQNILFIFVMGSNLAMFKVLASYPS
jgi:hypothetical protein